MAVYRYRACDDTGNVTSGELTTHSREEVLRGLEEQRLYPIHIEKVDSSTIPISVEEAIVHYFPVPRQRIANLLDQMATLLDAGIPIVDILYGIEEQESNARIREAIKKVRVQVENGAPLYAAMESCLGVFDETCVRAIQAGEQSGKLVPVLIRLSQTIEFDLQVRHRFAEATRYPKIVLTALLIAAGFLLSFVVPRFASLFARANVELPLATKVLIGLGTGVQQYWPLLLCLGLLGYVVLHLLRMNQDSAPKLERLRMKIPIWGDLKLKVEMSRTLNVLAMLIESGVNILNVFQLAAGMTKNYSLATAFLKIRNRLEHGESLSQSIGELALFPKAARQMIILGEKAGRLDESFEKISKLYEKEASDLIKRIHSMIEPFMILCIGILVIVFALAIFLPMWDLMKVVR